MNTDPIPILQLKLNQVNHDIKVMQKVLHLCADLREAKAQKENTQKLDLLLEELKNA